MAYSPLWYFIMLFQSNQRSLHAFMRRFHRWRGSADLRWTWSNVYIKRKLCHVHLKEETPYVDLSLPDIDPDNLLYLLQVDFDPFSVLTEDDALELQPWPSSSSLYATTTDVDHSSEAATSTQQHPDTTASSTSSTGEDNVVEPQPSSYSFDATTVVDHSSEVWRCYILSPVFFRHDRHFLNSSKLSSEHLPTAPTRKLRSNKPKVISFCFKSKKETYHRIREGFRSIESLVEACKQMGMCRTTFYQRISLVEMMDQTDEDEFRELAEEERRIKNLNRISRENLLNSPFKTLYKSLRSEGKLLP